MLKLTLFPDEYFTIDEKIIIQLQRIAGGRVILAVEAPREMPVLRGTLLEQQGGKRPDCLTPPRERKKHGMRDLIFPWNDDRERAVRTMNKVFSELEEKGLSQETQVLRKQLDRIIPQFWEENLAEKP